MAFSFTLRVHNRTKGVMHLGGAEVFGDAEPPAAMVSAGAINPILRTEDDDTHGRLQYKFVRNGKEIGLLDVDFRAETRHVVASAYFDGSESNRATVKVQADLGVIVKVDDGSFEEPTRIILGARNTSVSMLRGGVNMLVLHGNELVELTDPFDPLPRINKLPVPASVGAAGFELESGEGFVLSVGADGGPTLLKRETPQAQFAHFSGGFAGVHRLVAPRASIGRFAAWSATGPIQWIAATIDGFQGIWEPFPLTDDWNPAFGFSLLADGVVGRSTADGATGVRVSNRPTPIAGLEDFLPLAASGSVDDFWIIGHPGLWDRTISETRVVDGVVAGNVSALLLPASTGIHLWSGDLEKNNLATRIALVAEGKLRFARIPFLQSALEWAEPL